VIPEIEELVYCRLDAATTIVNLACTEENKHMLANHPGFLDEIICMDTTDSAPQAREHAVTWPL
jgi:hypothetical protein